MVTNRGPQSYNEVLTDAVADISANGFDSAQRIQYWQQKLREAAERSMLSMTQMEQQLREAMAAIYKRMVDNGGAVKFHQGVARFMIDRLRPQLHADLQRRIMMSADLIKLNRQQAIDKTLQRFSGWASSVPPGGTKTTDKVKQKQDIKKSLGQLPFEERRVIIDQGHKLTASINETIARGGAAIAIIWHSHFRQPGYDFRPDHKERDGHVYLLKGSWAQADGLIKPGPDGYYEDITSVAEEPFCRCWATYLYNLRDLPADMLTKKGGMALAAARKRIAEL